jgi:subtilase family serine protease
MSWGGGEPSNESSLDNSYFTTPAGHTGVTFFASSGDQSTIGFPATSSHVVAVGGTSLSVSGAGSYVSESAWGSSGGGLSQYESQPSYQAGLVISNGAQTISAGGKRAGPDVASDADPNTGVAVYGSYGFGGWAQVGGTSAGSPVWAGLMAVIDQGRVDAGLTSMDGFTQTLPALYALPSGDFHDVTTGSNGIYSAGTGFDLVTGRGTPIASLLVPALANNTGGASAKPPTVAQPAQVTSSTMTTVSLSALGADAAGASSLTYSWTATGPGAVSFSPNGTNAAQNATATLTAAGSYTFTVIITDPSGLSITSQVSATVGQVQTSVSVSPATATVAISSTKQLTATALDQFGAAMAVQPTSFMWSITAGGIGSISNTGLYTAPATTGTATIVASTGSFSGSAAVSVVSQTATSTTILAGPVRYYGYYALETLTIQVTPAAGTVLPTGTVQLFYNGSVLATGTLSVVNGVAVAKITIQYNANGNYTFTAQYLGSSTFLGSTSSPVTVTV